MSATTHPDISAQPAAQSPPAALDEAVSRPSGLASSAALENRIPGPKRTIDIVLATVLLGAVFLDYWEYSRAYHKDPNVYLDLIAGTGLAPAQYRIGVLDTAHFVALHTHLPLRHCLTLLDLVSAFTASFVLLTLLRRSRAYTSAGLACRWLGEVAFVALIQFYLAWLLWYQRPETLPTAALLALSLFCISIPLANRAVDPMLSAAGLLCIATAQSFVRADVVFAFNLGILIVCLFRARGNFVLGRRLQTAVSFAGLLIAVSIQAYLMRVAFPQATYGDTPVFQLVGNLKDFIGYPPFLCVMLPFAWALWRVVGRKARVSGPEAAILVAASIFAGMWFTVGIAQEVRIFLPYGLALIPVSVSLLLQVVAPTEEPLPEN